MTEKLCTYKKCYEPVNSPHDDNLCVFHAPKENKGITVEEFNRLIRERIEEIFKYNEQAQNKKDKKTFYFIGFIFPGDIHFTHDGTLLGKPIAFNYDAFFGDSQFSGDANFYNAKFSGDTGFVFVQFSGYANFYGAQFSGDASFKEIRFEDWASFENIGIKNKLEYINIILADKSRFYFRNPKFIDDDNNRIRIVFNAVQFNPFATYFENIRLGTNNVNACLIFRYCQLQDVYFTDNDMSLFSFYKSSFDQARFVSSRWGTDNDRIFIFPFNRKNVIPEEKFLNEIIEYKDDEHHIGELREHYKIKDLNNYEDIAALYRRMKTALDRTKDYQEASWFYFNEFEMKRKSLEEEIENSEPKRTTFRWQPCIWLNQQRKKIFSRYFFYFCYKVFSGYGEKPHWSFYWFLFFIGFFSIANLINGLEIGPKDKLYNINYNISFSTNSISQLFTTSFWEKFGFDFIQSLVYTLYRVVPVSYLPFQRAEFAPIGIDGLLCSFFNSLVLIILVIFIGTGLKRHFRRF